MKTMWIGPELRALIADRLEGYQRRQLPAGSLKKAAVALIVTDFRNQANLDGIGEQEQEQASLILTRRSGSINNHAGQWALPGGRLEKGEGPAETALREVWEEIGLQLTTGHVLGILDDYVTRSGYHITPVVIWGGAISHLAGNGAEVVSIHRIPFPEFLRDDAPWLESGIDSSRPVLYMPVGSTWVASPTAAMLYQFREVVLLGRNTAVHHFDQPRFAWK